MAENFASDPAYLALSHALGHLGGGVRALTSFVADYDCTTNDPASLSRPARSIVADGAVAIEDESGATVVLPGGSLANRQWTGFAIVKVLKSSSGTAASNVVVVW
jgi:hypothetical protein